MHLFNISITLCKISIIWTLGLLFSCSDQEQIKNCNPLNGLDEILIPGQVVLLGEIHGTKEGSEYIGIMACHALRKDLEVTIGLELPQSDQGTIDKYLKSKGRTKDQKSILDLPFWSRDYQDGRASEAMLNLLEYARNLKSSGEKINVVLIDNPNTGNRDLEMAQMVIQEAMRLPSNVMIVLTGNYHNMIYEGSKQMGGYV